MTHLTYTVFAFTPDGPVRSDVTLPEDVAEWTYPDCAHAEAMRVAEVPRDAGTVEVWPSPVPEWLAVRYGAAPEWFTKATA